MTYDARQIANWFVERAQRDSRALSIMQLLKLTYIAHGWNLEMKSAPLFSNNIQAWQYGPVIPEVYNAFRGQGVTISHPVPFGNTVIVPETAQFLEQIYGIYGGMSPFHLSDITHEAGGPWELATRMGGPRTPIPNDLIEQHYRLKRNKAEAQSSNV
jgi:uncharacterized phage-associated protein